jgi:hypothetical protein
LNQDWERAPRDGNASSLAKQLSSGAAIDSLDGHGQSALMLAARSGHLEAVRVLVEAGANLDVTAKFGLSALMLAVVNEHDAIARVLAAAGADLSLRGTGAPGFHGQTAADLARERGLDQLAAELSR